MANKIPIITPPSDLVSSVRQLWSDSMTIRQEVRKIASNAEDAKIIYDNLVRRILGKDVLVKSDIYGIMSEDFLADKGMVKVEDGKLTLAEHGADFVNEDDVLRSLKKYGMGDSLSGNGVTFYQRSFTDPDKNTVALGSLDTSTYKGTAVLLSLVCHQSGYEFSGTLRYTGWTNNTAGAWVLLNWEKWDDKNATTPSFFYEVMSDATTTSFRVRVMR